jgi:hypothetical protein
LRARTERIPSVLSGLLRRGGNGGRKWGVTATFMGFLRGLQYIGGVHAAFPV